MQKSIAILLLVWLTCLGGAHAQAPAPAWVNKLKLSGISGSAQHRLAVINNRTFSEGEVNELKVAGQTAQLKCLEIGQGTVVVQIQDTGSRYELIMSGAAIPLGPPPDTAPPQLVVPVQPPAPTLPPPPTVPPPSPKPRVSSLPVSPPQTTVNNGYVSTKAFSYTPFLFMGVIVLALLVGAAIGAGVRLNLKNDKEE